MNANDTIADREIVIIRTVDAPRSLVYQAWTDPKHLIKWWGPNGFTNTFHEISIKQGGIWRFTMHGPDGTDFPNLIRFTEAMEAELLEYEHGSGEKDDPAKFNVVVTFEDVGRPG